MTAPSDPNRLIAEFAIGGMLAVLLWRVIVWVREAPVRPDPWDTETDKKLSEPETAQTCHHCSTPQSSTAWFCPHCGNAVGQYNNLMPYVCIFSEGEIYRNGVNQRFRNRPLIVAGLALMTLGIVPFLAPLYWISLIKNLHDLDRPKADET
ncbi:MAG TPA: hypothetical protein VG347_00060 [Verrucomicrobiae bacterium]|nr:hypothetical protein [Verrucomicrobiae bacterium]